jgi:hypothetical protein
MANLIRRAAEELKKKNAQLQTIRANRKDEEAELIGAAVAVGSAYGAAYVDKKWGEGGAPAKLFDAVPANVGVGGALFATAIAMKSLGKARKPIAMAGIGLLCASAYRHGLDNLEVEPAA